MKKKNILLKEFESTQFIDESTIKCQDCKKTDKTKTYKNQFLICFTCKIYLCPLCRESHDKSHNCIDFELRHFICNLHFESYSSYCKDCKKDICLYCEKEHNNHKFISYGGIIPDINKLNNK